MNIKEKRKAIKKIKSLWSTIVYIVDNSSIQNYATELYKISLEESKQHDRFRNDGIKRGLSVIEEAKYFALKRVLDFVYELDKVPSLDDYLHIQKSVYFAYGIAFDKQNEIKQRITLEEAKYISSLDYCDLIEA